MSNFNLIIGFMKAIADEIDYPKITPEILNDITDLANKVIDFAERNEG